MPRPAPLVGVDLDYMDAPHVLLREFRGRARGMDVDSGAGHVLRDSLGLGAVRFNSFGFYSFHGPDATEAIRAETHAPNRFPWFPVDEVAEFAGENGLRLVLGLNPEEGPDAAVELAERLQSLGLLQNVAAFEIGNEPHLSKRPWTPEDYAVSAGAIITALAPYEIPCAVSLTVGSESKTPTGISDDEYTRRTLVALDTSISLARHPNLFGVIHLYGAGVDPASIDRLDGLVRPIAPYMRFLVTEFNIRSSLRDNAQLTDDYGLEFIAKTGRLVAHPDVAGLFVHAFPYHSVAYWVGDAGIATVSGYADPRLRGRDLEPGWHLTPAGRLYGLFARELWRGVLLTFEEHGPVQIWTTRAPDGTERLGVLNTGGNMVSVGRRLDGRLVELTLGPRSAAVRSGGVELGRVELGQ